jgi:hypothetical protein
MTLHKTSRKIHKWLMLLLSIQFLIWSISGFYMVVFDIDYIHGDSVISEDKSVIDHQKINYSFSDLLIDYPTATNIELSTFIGTSVYRFTLESEPGPYKVMLAPQNGKILPNINETMAMQIANYHYQGEAAIRDILLLKQDAPFELSSRHLPVWRINFDDFASSTLYISVQSGEIVTRRHQFWRIFDWMFSFHVMDYEDEDPANSLLLWVALVSFLAVISGLVLTYYRVIKGSFSTSKKSAFEKMSQHQGKQ